MVVKLCGYVLNKADVIGIGELYKEYKMDPVEAHLYGRVRLRFDLLFLHYKIEISTPWSETKGVGDELVNANKMLLSTFEAEYKELRGIVEPKIALRS